MAPTKGDTYEKTEGSADWSDIDWKVVSNEVIRLRYRIFQAKIR